MTVKNKDRWIRYQTIFVFMFLCASLSFGQKKNILHIRFQTVTVKPSTTDIILNVYYKIVAARSAVSFNGFDCRYSYDQSKIRPVDKFFDGTACQYADIKGSGGDPTIGDYRIEVLSSASLDTTNPILFQVRYSIKGGFTDSAMIAPTLFSPLSGSEIDSVIIDNSGGRDQTSWYPFGLVFMDTSKPPPPMKKSVLVSTDSVDIQSDSTRLVSVRLASLDSAIIKTAIFEFDVDTLAFDSVNILKGKLLSNGSLALSKDSSHVTANITFGDSVGSGELLQIVLRAKHRNDTLCTGLLGAKFTVLNTDNLVSSVKTEFAKICVLGVPKKDTVTKGVPEGASGINAHMSIYPNPASSVIIFSAPWSTGCKKHLVVSDDLGKVVLDREVDANFHWEVESLPPGFYTATVTDFFAFLDGSKGLESTKILIIH